MNPTSLLTNSDDDDGGRTLSELARVLHGDGASAAGRAEIGERPGSGSERLTDVAGEWAGPITPLEAAVGALDAAWGQSNAADLPASLAERLRREGVALVTARKQREPVRPMSVVQPMARSGEARRQAESFRWLPFSWASLAGAVLVSFWLGAQFGGRGQKPELADGSGRQGSVNPRDASPVPQNPENPTPVAPQSAAEKLALARDELLTKQPDALQLSWTATPDPAAQRSDGQVASGDLVWSTTTQQGFMRFRQLAVNDPTREQYQLWIFDADQDERYPVDGGVFDVSADGEVIVPITAKLRVNRPTLFAITVEKPGGVVVSTRERLPLLAKVEPSQG